MNASTEIRFNHLADLSMAARQTFVFLIAMSGRGVSFISDRDASKKWKTHRDTFRAGRRELVEKELVVIYQYADRRKATSYAITAKGWGLLGFEIGDGGKHLIPMKPLVDPEVGPRKNAVDLEVRPRMDLEVGPHSVNLNKTQKCKTASTQLDPGSEAGDLFQSPKSEAWTDTPDRRRVLEAQAVALKEGAHV